MRRWRRRRSLRETPSKRSQRRTLRPTRPRTARSDADRVTRRQRRKITRPPPENIRRARTQSAEASHTGTTRNQRTPSAQFVERGRLSEASQSDAGTSYKKKTDNVARVKALADRQLAKSINYLSIVSYVQQRLQLSCTSVVAYHYYYNYPATSPQKRCKAHLSTLHTAFQKKTKLPFSTR